jgi:iron complex transport system substrate-binding protein
MLRNVGCLVLAFAAALAGGSLLVSAAGPQREAANKALDYVRTLQNADGGFPLSGGGSDPGATIDAVFAFTARGIDAGTIKKDGSSPLDYLKAEAASYSDKPGPAAKLVLGLAAMEEDPGNLAGIDLLAKMNFYFDAATGSYGGGVFDHALYMLARARLDLSPAHGSASHLKSKQTADGCWEFSDGIGCDTNTTALGIEALLAAGVDPSDSAIEDALDHLEGAQNDDGGFPYLVPSDSDANSTAFVIQALVAAGEKIGDWDKGGTTPLEALLAFQNPQTGAFTYSGEDNAYATYQSIPALLLEPYPGAPKTREREATHTPKPTKTPTPTVTPTAEPTATPLPPSVAPTVVAPPLSTAPTSAVAGITVAAAGEGATSGEDSTTMRILMTLLLAGGGALTAAGGVIIGARRR